MLCANNAVRPKAIELPTLVLDEGAYPYVADELCFAGDKVFALCQNQSLSTTLPRVT